MADKYDPYRDALVVETRTIWPDDLETLAPDVRVRVAKALHADPEPCSQLEYVRVHTGFCRSITVTPEDLQRVRV
jgi:hypothetical protein